MRTLAMGVKSQAKHLRQASRFAKRRLKIDPAVVKARNAEMASAKVIPLKPFKTQAQQVSARVPAKTTISRKKAPTQAINPMQLSKYLAKTNPKQAIQAQQRFGQPLVGSAGVMKQLEMSAKIGAFLRKYAAAERVLFKGKSLLGIESPSKATATKLTTPKVPSPRTQKFGITTTK